jgi:hypothetical protein
MAERGLPHKSFWLALAVSAAAAGCYALVILLSHLDGLVQLRHRPALETFGMIVGNLGVVMSCLGWYSFAKEWMAERAGRSSSVTTTE